MTGAIWSLFVAQWRQRFNREWRFSTAKLGLWLLLLQVGLGAAALWRFQPAAGVLGPGTAFRLMLLQALLWSFLTAFMAGRSQLYGARQLALVHASAAEPLALVLATALGGLGRRAWSMLIWAAALGAGLGPVATVLLWLLGVAAGTLGHLAGLLALIAWVRVAPRWLGLAWVCSLVLLVGGLWLLIFQAAVGGMADLTGSLSAVRMDLVIGLALLFGLPGLAMLAWLGLAPARLGAAYRDGWLRLQELADGAARPRHSAWPGGALATGPVGAVLAKEWLLLGRNPATWFRLGALGLLATALVPAGPALARLAAGGPGRHDLVVLGSGLGGCFFALGEVIAAGFSAEGPRLALMRLAGVGAGRVLTGKLLGLSPFAACAALATWAVSVTIGDAPGAQARLVLTALAVGFGMAAIATGGAACDAAPLEPAEEQEEAALAALMEQIPRGLGGSAGFLGAALWGGACLWWPAAWAWLGPVPAFALLAGWWRLKDRLAPRDIS